MKFHPTSKNSNSNFPGGAKNAAGFTSIMAVISVGTGMLLLLVTMYDRTVESQNTQKDHMMRADYQQREEAFLRALTNIIPNKAMICMQDDSWDDRGDHRWSAIFEEALVQSNSREALSADRANDLSIDGLRSGNTIDSNLDFDDIVSEALDPPSTNNAEISAGINIAAIANYPPPLEITSRRNRDGRWPMITLDKKYGSSATGWVDADVDQYPLYNLIDAPSLHFNYKTGDKMIAKQNWWAFNLSMADQSETITNLSTRTKEYLISIYEVPSQLAINGSSFTTLGAHSDGTSWGNITTSGGVFAQKVKTEGSFSSDAISSRKGMEFSANTSIGSLSGSSLGSNPFASNERELSQSQGEVFPISSAANGGRVAFVPINRGGAFYDRFASDLTNNSSASSNAVSSTAWDYYSMGAQQCVMRVDIIAVVSDSNPTPTSIRFTYIDGDGGLAEQVYTQGDNWPDPSSTAGLVFPFQVDVSATGYTCLVLRTNHIPDLLTSLAASDASVNNSISINPDYINNTDIKKPSFPSEPSNDMGLLIRDSDNLSAFTKGFSIVTNLLTIIGDDINEVPTTAPAGYTPPSGSYLPPLSLFSPEKRWGDSATPMRVNVDGQLGSLSKGNTIATNIADLKSGSAGEVEADNITANLRAYDHPAELPPINIMNWMIVIQEVNPENTPE